MVADWCSTRSPYSLSRCASDAEIEPLVEIAHVILGDFQVDAVAILFGDANVAGVERARNRQGHALLLAIWVNFGG